MLTWQSHYYITFRFIFPLPNNNNNCNTNNDHSQILCLVNMCEVDIEADFIGSILYSYCLRWSTSSTIAVGCRCSICLNFDSAELDQTDRQTGRRTANFQCWLMRYWMASNSKQRAAAAAAWRGTRRKNTGCMVIWGSSLRQAKSCSLGFFSKPHQLALEYFW